MNEGIVTVDTEQEIAAMIQKLQRLPDKIAAPSILKEAINDTTRQVRRLVNRRAKKRYALKDSSILEDKRSGALQLYTATESDQTAELISKGPMLDLMKFITQPNMGTAAAAAKVINESSLKSLEMNGLKAFVVKFSSDHTAIAQRDPPKEYSSNGAAKRLAEHEGKGRTWRPDMTKIKKLLGPAVPHMMGVAMNMGQDEIDTTVYNMLQKHIDRRIGRANASH